MSEGWPFDDPPNVAVITTTAVIRQGRPILLVTHDEDDGGWQFLDGDAVGIAEVLLVGLDTVVRIAPEVRELADLPAGWRAWRDVPGQRWRRRSIQ